jgi:proteasome lid subunit RPN8/RPN11
MSAPAHPTVSARVLDEIYAHARREHPNECCGIIYGAKDTADADRPVAYANVQNQRHAEDPARYPRDARTAYNFDTRDLLTMQKSLRGDQPAKIIYHSHVEVGAYFSAEDKAAALCDDVPWFPVEYIVIDVHADGVRGATQFAWDPERKDFIAVQRY